MLYVNFDGLDNLVNSLSKVSNECDELVARLRRYYMEAEDTIELKTKKEFAAFMEELHFALEKLSRVNDSMQSLKNTMIDANNQYYENEKEKIAEVNSYGKYHCNN